MLVPMRAIPIRVNRQIGMVVFATISVFLAAGCASIDFDYPKIESHALGDTDQTSLGRTFSRVNELNPEDESGFYLLPDGIDALAMRLRLIKEAERTVDVQVYLLKPDIVGKIMLYRLVEAADRGVRVRLLLDDILTSGHDAGLAGLTSHPNFEIRIYNPFYRGFAGRTRSVLTNFGRVNRRMHNKNFVVDNQVAIVGGRNIADEYFDASKDARFSDLDVLGVGPVVTDVSAMFDMYWNHETAVPVPAFAEMPEDPAAELDRIRLDLARSREEALGSRYADALGEQVSDYIELDLSKLSWGPYELVYDSPDKGVTSRKDAAETIRTPLAKTIESAQHELIVASPYFVPRKSGIERFDELQREGVQVTIITNSLASQDQVLVHGGYSASRKKLLKSGVRLHEIRPDADQTGAEYVDPGETLITMHTKAFMVDREKLFIGSFNFDPRSAYLNTESGLILDSKELAEEFAAAVDTALNRRTYEVFLDEKGSLGWRWEWDGESESWDKEPQTHWTRRFSAGFARMLPIRGSL